MITHISQVLCRPASVTAHANSADCSQCNRKLNKLIFLCFRAIATGTDKDRERAAAYISKMGYDLKDWLPMVRDQEDNQ